MTKLTDLGFSKGSIFEVILSTYNCDGTPNAAPMGVVMQDRQTINLDLYNSSQTWRNLKTNKYAVINITGNIDIFYKTTFKETNQDGKLLQEWFEKSESVNAPKLRFADATIAISIVSFEPVGSDKTKFFCNVERINSANICPQVYCRAKALTLEAIIHATRVKAFVNVEKEQINVNKLLESIEDSKNVVNRVAPNSIYSAVMADLMQRIDSWRNKP
jgi:hypothetical protein